MATSDQILNSLNAISTKMQEFKPGQTAAVDFQNDFLNYGKAHLQILNNLTEINRQQLVMLTEIAKSLNYMWKTITPQTDADVQTTGSIQEQNLNQLFGTKLD